MMESCFSLFLCIYAFKSVVNDEVKYSDSNDLMAHNQLFVRLVISLVNNFHIYIYMNHV
jgi:hypothetical protein